VREDGTAATHYVLMNLARDVVVRYRRHGLALTRFEVDRVFKAWWVWAVRLMSESGGSFGHDRSRESAKAAGNIVRDLSAPK
jgi:hypothetical protein